MQKLGKREDQLMHIIWESNGAFVREIIDKIPEPKPHYNSVATMVKILVKKGFLKANKMGNSYRYEPVISLAQYRKQDLAGMKSKYFENSFSKLVTHFAKDEDLSKEELEEILRIIESGKSQ